ncbi:MAG: site-specific DNA-methyltransferase [Alphaproteobacteria bacterium]|nr:site-specific DNA-methyltransferase [Alphaproteobacteria bacterium]
MERLTIEYIPTSTLKPHPRNARTHSAKQVRQIAESMAAFGNIQPILIDEAGNILAGHGRHRAAQLLGHADVPSVRVTGLSEARKRAFRLADNKIAANAGWDREILNVEFSEMTQLLAEEGLTIEITGFAVAEIDQITIDLDGSNDPADDAPPPADSPAVSQPGDIWILGNHRLMNGNARSAADVKLLMHGEEATMAFFDPPYNVRIGSVVGRGDIQHAEFAEASGEMSPAAFEAFLSETLGNGAAASRDGAVHFICMDWRHVCELTEAAKPVYPQQLNTVVWVKTNAGQGSFYRSQHEMILVFRVGGTTHRNNIELGKHGRNRSNVWTYAGVNTFRHGRLDDLAAHPTVKPVALVADAIKDCTARGDIVLDLFCGSGTTILAAERVGRRCFALEIEPNYVDVAIRRWQEFTGRDAVQAESLKTFEEVSVDRRSAFKGSGDGNV